MLDFPPSNYISNTLHIWPQKPGFRVWISDVLQLLRSWSVWPKFSEPVERSLELWCCPPVHVTGESSQSSLGNTLWQAGDLARTCELLDDAVLGIQRTLEGIRVVGKSPSLVGSVGGFMSFSEKWVTKHRSLAPFHILHVLLLPWFSISALSYTSRRLSPQDM